VLRYILVTICIALGFYFALIFNSKGIALLCFAAVLFVVSSFVYLMLTARKVCVRLLFPFRIAEKQQNVGLKIEVRNETPLELRRIIIPINYRETHGSGEDHINVRIDHLKKGTSDQTKRLTIGQTGYYEFQTETIRVYDLLGFFYLNIRSASIAGALVMPQISVIPVKIGESVRHFIGEALVYDEQQSGKDPSETFEIREYRDGDKLQRVHWKLSARTDELMVKEGSHPKGCPVVLFMPEGKSTKVELCDYMTSLSFTLMDAGCANYVVWYSGNSDDITRMRVEDEESFFEAIMVYLQDSTGERKFDHIERYKEKYRGEQFLHLVYAKDDGTISVDDMKIDNLQSEIVLR